jgi:hypothetical protein
VTVMTFFIKFLIGLTGLVVTFIYLILALIRRKRSNFRMALAVFLSTTGIIIVFSVGVFLVRDRAKDYAEKETLLVAMREASLGGIHLRIYVDSTYDLGNESGVTLKGRVKIYSDTLLLLRHDSIVKSFVLEDKFLTEISNSGIRFLEIESNKLIHD